jgi:hypothetical protein
LLSVVPVPPSGVRLSQGKPRSKKNLGRTQDTEYRRARDCEGRGYEYPISNKECPTPKESGGNQRNRVSGWGREYPISNVEWPTPKDKSV